MPSRPLTHIWRRRRNCEELTAGAVGGRPGAGSPGVPCNAPAAEAPTPRRRSLRPRGRPQLPAEPPSRTGWRTSWLAFLDAEQAPAAASAAKLLMGCLTSGVDSYPDGGDPPELGTMRRSTLTAAGPIPLVAPGAGTPGWEGLPGHAGRHLHPGVPGGAARGRIWMERFPIFTADGEGRTCSWSWSGAAAPGMARPMCRTPMSW